MRKELNNLDRTLERLWLVQDILRMNLNKLQTKLALYNNQGLVDHRAELESLVNECLHYIGEEERK